VLRLQRRQRLLPRLGVADAIQDFAAERTLCPLLDFFATPFVVLRALPLVGLRLVPLLEPRAFVLADLRVRAAREPGFFRLPLPPFALAPFFAGSAPEYSSVTQ
jgi:hypothetical protein